MNLRNSIVGAALVLSVTACGGLKFVNSATNLAVPPSLLNRTLYADSSVFQYRPDLLIGFVLSREVTADGAKWSRVAQVLPDAYVKDLVVIDDGKFYNSIVDSSIATSASGQVPVMSVAASLDSKSRMELTIEDSAMMVVDEIPWGKLGTYVTNAPRRDNETRVWVQVVMLTKMYLEVATETKSDATVSGSGYKANGKVFNASGSMQRQAYITMLLVDLDEYEDSLGNGDPAAMIDFPPFSQFVEGPALHIEDEVKSIYRAITIADNGIEGLTP